MSDKRVMLRDRHLKAIRRALEYQALKPILWARTPRAEPRLTAWEVWRYRRWLFWKHGGAECQYCGRSMPLDALTIDHIQPRSKGGAMRDIQNMALACLGCNKDKDDKWL